MTVNVGVVGLGYWGPNFTRNLLELPGFGRVVVCDKDPDKLVRIAGDKKYRGDETVPDLDHILSDRSIGAIVVATPTMTHYDVAKACLEVDKHVLVEKPLTFDPAH